MEYRLLFILVKSSAETWGALVVGDLLKKHPPTASWRGWGAGTARLMIMLPTGILDSEMKKLTKLNEIEKSLQKRRD